jgi:hypothetical protein
MASDGGKLAVWVIYRHPSDYPGLFVLRRQWAGPGGITHDPAPAKVGPTLASVRAAVPPGLVRFLREPSDDPVIVESWL